MRGTFLAVAAATTVMTLLQGCGNGGGGTDAGSEAAVDAGPPPSYEQVQAIFTTSCAIANTSCHNTNGHQRGLTLTADVSYGQIVGVASQEVTMQRVNPGHPESSWLQVKIEGTMASVPECATPDGGVALVCGQRMPMVAGTVLTPEQIATIRAWIAGGAPGPTTTDAGAATDAAAD